MNLPFFALPLAFFPGGVGTSEMIIIGIVAVLLFGKRLPEVGRSLGKGLMEFKKGMQGIEDEIRTASTATTRRTVTPPAYDDRDESLAPKFEPPQAEPREETGSREEAAPRDEAQSPPQETNHS